MKISKNQNYTEESQLPLVECILDLLKYQEERIQKSSSVDQNI